MAERPTIAELAEAVADGRPVDWAAIDAGAAGDAERAAIERLKRVQELTGRLRSPGTTTTSTPGSSAGSAAGGSQPVDARARWGHLALLEKVGEGAFGEVYRAHDPKLARDVALKLLRTPAGSAADTTSAIEEGRLLARIRHPNVVTVYGADRIDGRVGLWMEFVPGRTLEQELQDRGRFDAPEATRIGIDLARALAAVHAAGLVHRDVKAQNVMREADGRLVLMDFGTGREQTRSSPHVASDLAGTPLYVAPEVLRGEPATARSDIYSLGVLLYHLVTGSYPTTAETLSGLVAAHREQARTSLGMTRPDLPPAFVAVVERAVMADPGARYGTASEMEASLSGVLAGADRPARRQWRTAATVLAAVIGTAVIGAAAMAMFERPGWTTTPAQPLPGRLQSDFRQNPADIAAPPFHVPPMPGPTPAPPSVAVSWVLIAAFENRTGDATIDGAVENVLERELVQAPYVRVASQARIGDALNLMRQPADARLDPKLAREICLRDGGIHVFISGRVEARGHGFALTAEIADAAEGGVTAPLDEAAPSARALPAAIRRLSLKVRAALGEHADSIEASRLRLERVTTPSMEALRLYTQGLTAMVDGNPDRPDLLRREQFFRDAITADAGFAAAYLMLAVTSQAQRHEEGEYGPFLAKAVQLAGTATQPERDLINGISHYWQAQQATGDTQRSQARRAAAAFQNVLRADPANALALTSLNSADGMAGIKFDAIAVRSRVDLRPLDVTANINASMAAMRESNVRASDTYYRAALRADPDNPHVWLKIFPAYKAWADGDVQAAANELDKAWRDGVSQSAPDRARLASELTQMWLTIGRVRRAAEIAHAIPDDQTKFRIGAIGEVLKFQKDGDALGALLMPHIDEPLAWPLRDLWVSAGKADEARSILKKSGREDLSLELHIACVQRRYDDAVSIGEQYRGSLKGERPSPRQSMAFAEALKRLGRREEAIKVLEPDASVSAAMANSSWPGYLWLQLRADLAKLYRETGKPGKAREIEQDLLARLDAADPDFPLRVELTRRAGK